MNLGKLFRQIVNMEYCHHVSYGALDYDFDMLEKIEKQVHWATGITLAYFPALQKIIAMWSVLVSCTGAIIEDAHLS